MTAVTNDAGVRPDEWSDLGALRWRISTALAVMFAMAMAAAGPFIDWPFGRDGWILRLLCLAALMPPIMVVLARSVLRVARRIDVRRAELWDLYEQARLDSLVDPLTGLGNHRAFQEELARQVEDARRQGTPIALMLMDLDDLKRINDELGHAGGDALLAQTGHLLGSGARRGDRAFRIGGDEFVVLMPRTNLDGAMLTARRLLAAALDGAPAGEGRPFSFSAGVSAFPVPSASGARLFRHADAALYWCKRHGRTDVQPYDPDRHGQAGDERNSAELTAAVADIARNRTMSAVYQPIFSLATGAVVGHEGLIRPLPGSGFLDAEALFTAAEATGRTAELDRACIQVVASSAGGVPADRYLAVNISPRTLESIEFNAQRLASIFDAHGIPAERLVLELTERESVEDMDRLRHNLESCRSLGIRIAADDVGAGNAGLRMLSELTFDLVKIDLSLVQSGVLRESSMAVLSALRELANRSSATIVAEGIETADQLLAVRDLGLTAGQGYLLGRPTRTPVTAPADIAQLIATDMDRRRELLGTTESAA
ncbi:MAG TPA: bifunctional diguanylate cyclase/phosphodiesterase [Patescibacteria group bacterium]|nr:bifunctional diguanylate cyclase/phosphodiesterase [Patescibacteria group bacterium]